MFPAIVRRTLTEHDTVQTANMLGAVRGFGATNPLRRACTAYPPNIEESPVKHWRVCPSCSVSSSP